MVRVRGCVIDEKKTSKIFTHENEKKEIHVLFLIIKLN